MYSPSKRKQYRFGILVVSAITMFVLLQPDFARAQPLRPLSESSVNPITEIYGLTKTARKYDDFEAISKRCTELLADGVSDKDQKYLDSLVGWAENRLAGKELENAIGLEGIGLDEQARVELSKAISRYDGLIESHPSLWRAWMGRAVIHARAGEYDPALKKFRKVLKLDVKNDNARFNIAEMLYQLQEYQPAIKQYSKVLIDDSADVEALTGRGHSHLKLKQFAQAFDDFDTVTKLVPDNRQASSNLKLAKSLQHQPAETLTSANQQDLKK